MAEKQPTSRFNQLAEFRHPYPIRRGDGSAPRIPRPPSPVDLISLLSTKVKLFFEQRNINGQVASRNIPYGVIQPEAEHEILDIFLKENYSYEPFLAAAIGDLAGGYYRKATINLNQDRLFAKIPLVAAIPFVVNSIAASVGAGHVVIDPNLVHLSGGIPEASKALKSLIDYGLSSVVYAGLPFVALKNKLRPSVKPEGIYWRFAYLSALKTGRLGDFVSSLYSYIEGASKAGRLNEQTAVNTAGKEFVLAEIVRRPVLMLDLMGKYLYNSDDFTYIVNNLRSKGLFSHANYLSSLKTKYEKVHADLPVVTDPSFNDTVNLLKEMEIPEMVKMVIASSTNSEIGSLFTDSTTSRNIQRDSVIRALTSVPYSPLSDTVFSLAKTTQPIEKNNFLVVAHSAMRKIADVIPDRSFDTDMTRAGGPRTTQKLRETSAWSSYGVLMNVLNFLSPEQIDKAFTELDEYYRKKRGYKASEVLPLQMVQILEKTGAASKKAAEILYTYYSSMILNLKEPGIEDKKAVDSINAVLNSLRKRVDRRGGVQTARLSADESINLNNLVSETLKQAHQGLESGISTQFNKAQVANSVINPLTAKATIEPSTLSRLIALQSIATFISDNFQTYLSDISKEFLSKLLSNLKSILPQPSANSTQAGVFVQT